MSLAQQITKALELGEPMTARDVAASFGAAVASVRAKLSTMSRAGKVHIAGWRRVSDGGRLYPRALWAAGPATGRTPRKPKPLGDSAYGQRYRDLRRVRVSSVWDLAKPVADRRIGGVTR